jgi:methylthioribose-1-phosphate isomerase
MELDLPHTLRWENNQLILLDQRKVPQQLDYVVVETLQQAWDAIHTLTVRGAPAIGIAAAYALAQSMRDVPGESFADRLKDNADYLKSARPTAVNLAWAVDQLVTAAEQKPDFATLEEAARHIHFEDELICRHIGEHGAELIHANANLLTHCNAGSLAVSRFGTATAPMYFQHAAGVPFHVYVDETRPLYQGARLTAWELSQSGIDVTLICDNMAASIMAQGKVDLVIVGTDRVTANGDVVNKIGTFNLAVLCHHFDIPFYVACPSSTYDEHTPTGADVAIEERDAAEVLQAHAADVRVYNPAFDVTPTALVTGIITERGIAHSAEDLRQLIPRSLPS